MSVPSLDLFVACLPGLEAIVAEECAGLGMDVAGDVRSGDGGVVGRGDADAVARLNVRLGAASHVLVRVAGFGARHFAELRRRTASLPWRDWLGAGVPFAVSASTHRSKLYHTGAIAERVAGAIGETLGRAPAVDDADAVRVVARIVEDRCTLSLDTSGRPLHEQGWRLESAKAPLREDLAHALVAASGWTPGTAFVDPFCGSGTLPIVAARRALGIAPGRSRAFAGERLPCLATDRWQTARADLEPAPGAPILGSDRDAGAVAIAARNAERAGVADAAHFDVAAVSAAPGLALDAPSGAVVTNPPFGRRVGGDDLAPLYQTLGARLLALPSDWHIALLTADRRLALRTGLDLHTAFLTNHGGLRVRALCAHGRRAARA